METGERVVLTVKLLQGGAEKQVEVGLAYIDALDFVSQSASFLSTFFSTFTQKIVKICELN